MDSLLFHSYAELFESGKRYSEISIDLPWHFRNWSADKPGEIHDRARGANKHYGTMLLQDLAVMPPPLLPDGLLFFWTISSHIQEAVTILAAWDLHPITKAWTWIKTSKAGTPRMGQGYYTRHATEDCWIATRKNGRRPVVYNVNDVIFEQPREHSRKPEQHFERIDRMYPEGLKLDMYGRYPRPGWDIMGNQIQAPA